MQSLHFCSKSVMMHFSPPSFRSPVDEFFFSAMLFERKINLFTAVGMLQVQVEMKKEEMCMSMNNEKTM